MNEPSAVDRETFLRLVRETMADVAKLRIDVEEMTRGHARVRLGFDPGQLRPGGTISGPTIFMVADLALYAATLSVIGLVPLAVTTDTTIHFLRRPKPVDLSCDARVIKSGKRMIVAACEVRSEGDDEPVAHVVGSYSVPPASP
jgi:uncharacterized protein (TIGR00369 family)